MFLQQLGPSLEGGRLRRELHGLAARQLLVSRLQVFEQDAPGDAVNGEVMYDDEETTRPPLAEVEEGDAHERPALDVKALVKLCPRALDGRKRLFVAHARKVYAREELVLL